MLTTQYNYVVQSAASQAGGMSVIFKVKCSLCIFSSILDIYVWIFFSDKDFPKRVEHPCVKQGKKYDIYTR